MFSIQKKKLKSIDNVKDKNPKYEILIIFLKEENFNNNPTFCCCVGFKAYNGDWSAIESIKCSVEELDNGKKFQPF